MSAGPVSPGRDEALRADPFDEVLDAVRAGRMVVMTDDTDRENEGDLVIPTELVEASHVAEMASRARGLVCVSVSGDIARRLRLPLQAALDNASPFGTPFTVSVDHRDVSGRGVSARARALTMRHLVSETSTAEDFVSPGHVFPLVADPAGVFGRRGQTEGSFDLARLAGFAPSGVICEVLGDDGTMLRGADLVAWARGSGYKITSVDEVVRHRIAHESMIRVTADASLPTDHGTFRTTVFRDDADGKEHLALVYGDPRGRASGPGVLVRLHSECLTGDVFGSARCDCGSQLDGAMRRVVDEGAGVILYLRQEGRGIGLTNKLLAYGLQDLGADTVEANERLGFAADERDFAVAAMMLRTLGVKTVRLMTNNPAKTESLSRLGIEVVSRVPLVVPATEHSRAYLDTKRRKLGHLL